MTPILVLGGGACGLATAMLLARDGHDVTVLERDPAPVPDTPEAAWERWERAGVSQFRQAHFLQPRACRVLEAALPDVLDALIAQGAVAVDPADRLRAMGGDGAVPGDEALGTFTARRTTIEQVLGRAAEDEPRVEVRRGVAAEALLARDGTGVPHVTGVRTTGGEELRAELVVDALGRRSRLPEWLRAAGAAVPVHEEAEDSGFLYYTRFFHGTLPVARAPFNMPLGTFSLLTLPGDNGTWSVTVYTAAGDRPLKAVRYEDRYTALVRACPLHAHWLDGEPLSGIEAMGGVMDRYRRMVAGGRPVATGVLPVADAWACTNPSAGRGIALGLMQAAMLPEIVREHAGDPPALVTAWDEATEREVTPWYRATVAADRARLAEIDALRQGRVPPPPDGLPSRVAAALPAAMGLDPDAFRAGLEIIGCLALPQDVFARPGLAERVLQLAAGAPPQPPMAPPREEVLALLAA
jgi:2-polyprenyl-6-methoxyphenol hydroxylase-like FAD-dependent oxidoreductase